MNKWCPVCQKEEWDYDVCDGVFTYCRNCHDKVSKYARNHFKKIDKDGELVYKLSDWLKSIAAVIDAKADRCMLEKAHMHCDGMREDDREDYEALADSIPNLHEKM